MPGQKTVVNDETASEDYFQKVYINALKYYADENSANKKEMLFSSIFLYSLGDEQLYKQIENEQIQQQIKKETDFFASNLISSMQFRIKDRQFILDVNNYDSLTLQKFLSFDTYMTYRNENELFSLIMANLNEKYIGYEGSFTSLLQQLVALEEKYGLFEGELFTGLIDNNAFDSKFSKEEQGHHNFKLDGFFRSEMKTWQTKYNLKSKIENLSSDIYPYVDAILYGDDEYLVLLTVTELDENYIDNKTEASDKVFDCSLFIYKNQNFKIRQEDLIRFRKQVSFYLGKFVNDCALNLLQTNMDGSIGEAADISRYWYSEGLDILFDPKKQQILENRENSLEFYAMFIETLLCKIDTQHLKIEKTEIYPFDRVFIFPESGLDKDFRGINKILVLEAKIRSKDPEDRGGYLVGWEQDVSDNDKNSLIDEVDLVMSDKKINKISWHLSNQSCSNTVDPSSNDSYYNFQRQKLITPKKGEIGSNLLLSTLLLSEEAINNLNDAEKKKYEGQKRMIRESFDDYGLYYEYEFGLALKEVYPVLFDLQQKYFNVMMSTIKTKGTDNEDSLELRFDEESGAEYKPSDYPPTYRNVNEKKLLANLKKQFNEKKYKSKVVTVCFDPERVLGKDAQDYLGIKDRITMIFVADKDPVKTTSELKSEKEDLKVLLQMVIRQIIYNAENLKAINQEKDRLRKTLPQALHTVKGFIDDSTFKEKVDNLLMEYKAKFDTNDESGSKKSIEFNSDDNFNDILARLIKYDHTTFYQLVESIKNERIVESQTDAFDLRVQLNETALPGMEIMWDHTFIPEAFHVLLKNAVQHATMYGQASKVSKIFFSMNVDTQKDGDYLIIQISNNTTPISESRFKKLNDEKIEEISKNEDKAGSTGIGIVLARKQLASVSSYNNIKFSMIAKDMINAQMRLKINILKSNTLFAMEENDSMPEKISDVMNQASNMYDVIYFEDTPEYYEKTLDFLKDKNINVNHSKFLETTHMTHAKLLLTDMSILDFKGEANEEEGLEAVYQFKNQNKHNAPICILSNGMANEIRDKIMSHLDITSDEDIIILNDYTETLKLGKIYIINNVKVLNNDHKSIINYINNIHETLLIDLSAVEPKDDEIFHKSLFLEDNGEYNDLFHARFSTLNQDISSSYFFVATVSGKNHTLNTIFEKWFDFKTERAGKPGRSFTVSNVTYHKNTLLIIDNISILDEREQWWLMYLGMTHNIIFNFHNLNHSVILERWNRVAIKREASGYFSKLRHDVKNYIALYEKTFKNKNLTTLFQDIVNHTTVLQRILQSGKYESIKHYIQYYQLTEIVNEHKLSKGGELHMPKEQKLFDQANEVLRKTKDIDQALQESIAILKNAGIDNANLENLTRFHELVVLNIDLCKVTVGEKE
jgi:hypothetical protein